jgi:dTDP-4-amino-4,6-dideoxygalactose transaminase
MQKLLSKDMHFTQFIAKWEKVFAHYIGVKYAVAVSSGRKGMELILRSLELKRGDEVIIPAYTLEDLIGIIQSLELTVIPADIDPKTFNIDPNSIAEKITARTRVILATHLFGTPCQIDKILEIAKSKSIFVIEDCAHSVGAEFQGRKTGFFGNASFFSLETIKPINTYGGGMVVTNDEDLVTKIRRSIIYDGNQARIPLKKIFVAYFENWFLPTPLSFPFLYLLASHYWSEKAFKLYRAAQRLSASKQPFTDFQAFIGLEKLKTLEKKIAIRQSQANLLKLLLGSSIIPQKIGEGMSTNYYFFVALLPSDTNTWQIRKYLLMHGIDAGIGAEIADDCGSILGRKDCPNTREVFRRGIQLPLYEGMPQCHIRYVAKILGNLFK